MESSLRVVLCEKPSVARDIARHLKATQKKDGYFEGAGWAVTWAFGHLLELKDPHEYRSDWKSWRIETLPMLPEVFQLKPRGDKGARAQLTVVKKLFKEAAEIICATDAGREGELIFRYIQQHAGATRKPFRRLWVSSLTQEALEKGFAKLQDGHEFDALYRAARCRSEADWIVGLNATRYFTVLYGTGGQLWSLGRVQTPVLAMIVARDLEIAQFQPEDYWEVHTIYRGARFRHVRGRIDAKPEAEAICAEVLPLPLRVTDLSEKEELVKQPSLYDLTDLQKDLNKRFGMSADRTLKAAQSLYEKKHLTYPRTDSKYLTQDIAKELPSLLLKLKSEYTAEISKLNLDRLDVGPRVVNDVKVTDHHAIIPTPVLPNDSLSPDEATVYNAVAIRLIAAFYPPGKKRVINAKAEVGRHAFKASASVSVDLGWEELYPRKVSKKDAKKQSEDESETDEAGHGSALLSLTAGEEGPHAPELKTLQTRAPLAFTEGTLLHMMETAGRSVEDGDLKQALKEKGLGTPATRAAIIETLLARGYVDRLKKNIVSTPEGQRLISLVQDRRLKSPELTGEWEYRLKQIENGEQDPQKFMGDVAQYTCEILGVSGEENAKAGIGPCPKCAAQVIEGKRGFGCSQWTKGCQFVLWKDLEGAQISAGIAAQLLRFKRTSSPVRVFKDAKVSYANLKLEADASVLFEFVAMPEMADAASEDGRSLGACPKCGGAIVESAKAFGCENWREGCKFAIWKNIAKKKISQKIAKELLVDGKSSEVIQGFKSKAGQEFSARLVLQENEVRFEFSSPPPSSRTL